MIDRPLANDEERQLNSLDTRRNGMEADRATPVPSSIPQPSAPEPQPNSKKVRATRRTKALRKPEQSLFACFPSKRQMHNAVRIPCHRFDCETKTLFKGVQDNGQPARLANGSTLISGKSEYDSQITEKLVAACYQHYGNWKKYIPFYGITSVREVEAGFQSVASSIDRH